VDGRYAVHFELTRSTLCRRLFSNPRKVPQSD